MQRLISHELYEICICISGFRHQKVTHICMNQESNTNFQWPDFCDLTIVYLVIFCLLLQNHALIGYELFFFETSFLGSACQRNLVPATNELSFVAHGKDMFLLLPKAFRYNNEPNSHHLMQLLIYSMIQDNSVRSLRDF